MVVMNSCMKILGEVYGGSVPNIQEKNGRIRTHSFGVRWLLHQFGSYSEIHPYTCEPRNLPNINHLYWLSNINGRCIYNF